MTYTLFNLAMIVEDGILDALLTKNLLISNNVVKDTIIYDDPLEALAYIEKASRAKALNYLPDLIILDLNLPHITGFELLERLRHNRELKIKETKVIITTSSDATEDIQKSAEYKNVINYFIKPLHNIDFINLESEEELIKRKAI